MFPGRADVKDVDPAVNHSLADLGSAGVVLLVGKHGSKGPLVGQVSHYRLLISSLCWH